MGNLLKKLVREDNVYELALERMRITFARFDHISVSFSGGKDSTAAMQIALTVARELGRLPLDVWTFDEEAIPPETVEYMERVRQDPEIRFTWFCLPVKHRNACSTTSPYWYCWDDDHQDKWVRSLPEGAIHTMPWFKRGMEIPDCSPFILPQSLGTVAMVMGIRCDESLTRLRAVATKPGFECFTNTLTGSEWIQKVYPVYDWNVKDVWVAPKKLGWDYNKAYDVMEMQGVTLSNQRCCPPFGEQPIRGLSKFKTCWPELWNKMVDRVPGAATAARYANTELYGVGVLDNDKPKGLTWRAATLEKMEKLEAEAQLDVAKAIKQAAGAHKTLLKNHGRPFNEMPDTEPDKWTGWCWKILFKIAAAGGNKLNRQWQKANTQAILARQKNNVPLIKRKKKIMNRKYQAEKEKCL